MNKKLHNQLLDNLEPVQPKVFVSYPYMIAIMACLQVLVIVYGAKYFDFFGFKASAGWLILMPIMMYIFQIVSECYGWQYARQIAWCNFIVNGLTTIVFFGFKYITFSDGTSHHQEVAFAYSVVTDNRWIACVTMWIGIFLSDFITSALMSWSRFHWNGRLVFLRMIILHLLSECIMLSGSFIVLPFRGYTVAETWHLNCDSFIARSIMSLLMLPLARFITWYIQYKVEGVVVFDYKSEFSLFKLSVTPTDSVHFHTLGWRKINTRSVDIKKLANKFYESRAVINIKIF
jgi:hypothetical protein